MKTYTEKDDNEFLSVLVALVLLFSMLVLAVDNAYARGGEHHGGYGYGRSYNHHGSRHGGYRGYRRSYYGGGYGYNNWEYGLAVGAGIGFVNWIATPRPYYHDRVIVREVPVRTKVIYIEKEKRYTPPKIDYRYHKIIEPEAVWEH